MKRPHEGATSRAEIAMGAFHLGEELGFRPGQDPREWNEALFCTLRDIAEGGLTLIGSDLPAILAMPEAKKAREAGAGNRAVAVEREAARLVLQGYLEAQAMMEDEDE